MSTPNPARIIGAGVAIMGMLAGTAFGVVYGISEWKLRGRRGANESSASRPFSELTGTAATFRLRDLTGQSLPIFRAWRVGALG